MRKPLINHAQGCFVSLYLCIVIMLGWTLPLPAAGEMTRFVAQPGSKVSIKGSCDLHDFEVQGEEIDGEVEFGAGFPATISQTAELGRIPARVAGFIPVRSLHKGKSKAMDEVMYNKLKEPANPRILFRFSELTLKSLPRTNDAPYVFQAQGELVVSGVTNKISLPIGVLPLTGNRLKITANAPIKMTDVGIQPPQLRFADFTIKYRDEVELNVVWLLKRES